MQILTSEGGAILRLQINRPEKRNALTNDMYDEMASALQEAAAAPGVRVVLIHGLPYCFCGGNDLQDFMHAPPTGERSPVGRFIKAFFEKRAPKFSASAAS
jgi:enoyl-CoA hydratase/carnithine racemase